MTDSHLESENSALRQRNAELEALLRANIPDRLQASEDRYRLLVENAADPRRSRVFIEAIRAIKPGEELTYDYGIRLAERHTPRLKKIWACRCGAKTCTGTMLKPKR